MCGIRGVWKERFGVVERDSPIQWKGIIMNKKTRACGIELLKIICMIMIVISHSIPKYGEAAFPNSHINLLVPTKDVQTLVILIFNYLGQMANGPFIVCSAYFLLDSSSVKSRKVWNFVFDTFLFSIAFLVVGLGLGFDIPKSDIIRQILPITYENNWFVGCYLLLYLIHPFLNMVIEKMSQKQLLTMNIIAISLYCGIGFILENKYYYTVFIGFIIYYFITAYVKKYMQNLSANKKWNLWVMIFSVVAIIVTIIVTNYFGFHLDVLKNQMCRWCKFINPFIVLFAISSFNLFKQMKFQNKAIETTASVSLLVYIIHENYIFYTYGKPLFFDYIYRTFGYEYVALWCLVFAAVCFVGSLIIALIYKYTLQKLVIKVCDILVTKGGKITDKVLSKIMNIS